MQAHTPSIESLMRMVERDPLDPRAYGKLAESYVRAGEFHKAELTLRRALEICPLDQQSWSQLGALHLKIGQWQSAVDALEQACTLDPEDFKSAVRHCMALIATQNVHSARELGNIILEKYPGRSETHLIQGHLNRIQGHMDEARRFYERALELDPMETEALFNLAQIEPANPPSWATGRLEQLQRSSTLSQRERANVCFALARIYEAADRIDAAFALLQEGNLAASEMMRGLGQDYVPRFAADEAAELMTMFGAKLFPTQLEPLDLDMKMIFIVGFPRSGTTLFERILSRHSKVGTGGELPFMEECLARFRAGHNARGKPARIDLADPWERRFLLELREYYLDRLFERDLDREYVIDKLPANYRALGLIRLLFPDAIIVHCSRDPIATCWSLYAAHFGIHQPYYNSLENLAHYYGTYRQLMDHWQSVLVPGIVEVHYEQLVLNPQAYIHDLLHRCGLNWDPACLDFHANELPVYTASMQQVRRPIYSDSNARWRRFERFLGPLLAGLAHPQKC